MLRKLITTSLMALLAIFAGAVAGRAQSIDRDQEYGQAAYDQVRIDRNLDVEVWSDHYDGEYYDGDNIVIYFRSNRDAFVSIYSIDTRGRVNLLFPTDRNEDNFVRGGVTYSLPGDDADFDLEVDGPEGFENIQIVASRERFDVPNWYRNSGLVCDWDDRADYMDYLNAKFFVRYSGQRFAYDRAVIYVNEWESDYYRPIYRPYYPSWTVYGNCYIDYPWGGSVYVNGIYWGCAPLYIPRIAVGWHVVTIYDRYGDCWESDFHVSRYNTVVFDRTVIHPQASIKSKYKEVRLAGYRNPVTNGYPNYKSKTVVNNNVTVNNTNNIVGKSRGSSTDKSAAVVNSAHKYVRGSTKLVKTDRGYETDASSAIIGSGRTKTTRTGSTNRIQNSVRTGAGSGKSVKGSTSGKSSGNSYRSGRSSVTESSGYYQKKSGSSSSHGSSNSVRTTKSSKSGRSSSSSSTSGKRSSGATKSSGNSGSYKRSTSSSDHSSGAVKSSPSKSPSKSTPSRKSGGSKVKSSPSKGSNSSGGSKTSKGSSRSGSSSTKKKSGR